MKEYNIPFILQRIIWGPIAFLFYLVGYRVHGTEYLKTLFRSERKKGILIVANHVSQLDPLLIASSIPFLSPLFPIFFTSRDRNGYQHMPIGKYLYGGSLFSLFGGYPIGNGTGDYEKSLSSHLRLLKEGNTVCIFPEGKIIGEKDIRGGVAFLMAETGVPVVPVFHDREKKEIRFGPPLRIIEGGGYKEMARKIMGRVYELGRQ